MVLMNCLSSCSLPWQLLAMLAKVVRRKTASDVNVFSSMSANWALWVWSGGVVSGSGCGLITVEPLSKDIPELMSKINILLILL